MSDFAVFVGCRSSVPLIHCVVKSVYVLDLYVIYAAARCGGEQAEKKSMLWLQNLCNSQVDKNLPQSSLQLGGGW